MGVGLAGGRVRRCNCSLGVLICQWWRGIETSRVVVEEKEEEGWMVRGAGYVGGW